MPSERRPAPNASGTLAATPVAHALVYARNRSLTGRLELRAGESESADPRVAEIHFWRGQIFEVRVTPSPCYLGAVVYERGWIDSATLDGTLLEVAQKKLLHGQVLIARRAITSAQLDEALIEQMCRKVHQTFTFPPESSFAFYESQKNDEPPRKLDPLAPFWRGVCDIPPRKSMNDVLGRFFGVPLRLVSDAPLVNVGLSKDERELVTEIGLRPMLLEDICAYPGVTGTRAELVAYLLLAAKCVEPVAASRPNMPAVNPSRSISQPKMPAISHSEPRMQAASPSQPRMPATPVSEPRITASAASNEMRRPSFSFKIPSTPGMKPIKVPGATTPSTPPVMQTPEALGIDGIKERAERIDRESYFEVLGLPEGASMEAVRAAYFRLARLWHPDKIPVSLARATGYTDTIFSTMTRAHQTLTDATARKGYLSLRPAAPKRDRVESIRTIETALARQDFTVAETESCVLAALDAEDAEAKALVAWSESWAGCASEDLLRASVVKLDRAIAEDRHCDRAHYYRGALHLKLGDPEAAHRDFTRAAQINPRHVDAQREIRLYEMRAAAKKRWI